MARRIGRRRKRLQTVIQKKTQRLLRDALELSFQAQPRNRPGYRFLVSETNFGRVEVLQQRMRDVKLLNPDNWVSVRDIQTEGPRGHIGARFESNLEITVKGRQGKTTDYVLKLQRMNRTAQPVQEIEAAMAVRESAGVLTETPVGYITFKDGKRFAIFRKHESRTMLYRAKNDFEPVLDASRKFGRLYKAGISIQDIGPKHLFVEGKRVRVLDLEFFKMEPKAKKRQEEFSRFLAYAVSDGNIRNISQMERAISEFSNQMSFNAKPRALFERRILLGTKRAIDSLIESGQKTTMATTSGLIDKQKLKNMAETMKAMLKAKQK